MGSDSRSGQRMPSIAVMPFINLSAVADSDYFCEGLAEELISALTQIKGVFVVARASAFSFRGKDVDVRDIGRRLNVDTILEGSVQRGATDCGYAELVDAANCSSFGRSASIAR